MSNIISSLQRWFSFIHLSYSYLTAFSSLFLFPFNICLLLIRHREAVYSLRLHSDCDRPTIIFHTTFLYQHIFRYSIHGTPRAKLWAEVNFKKFVMFNFRNMSIRKKLVLMQVFTTVLVLIIM